jgi:hypothetical protein
MVLKLHIFAKKFYQSYSFAQEMLMKRYRYVFVENSCEMLAKINFFKITGAKLFCVRENFLFFYFRGFIQRRQNFSGGAL